MVKFKRNNKGEIRKSGFQQKRKRATHHVDSAIIEENIGDLKANATKYNFAIRLNDFLANEEITQTDLAKDAGISSSSLSEYRGGSKEPTLTSFANIVKTLGISADYLLGISEIKKVDLELDQMNKHTGLSEKALESLNEIKKRKESDACNNYITETTFVLDVLNLLLEKEHGHNILWSIAGYLFTDFETKADLTQNDEFVLPAASAIEDKNTKKTLVYSLEAKSMFLVELQKEIVRLHDEMRNGLHNELTGINRYANN